MAVDPSHRSKRGRDLGDWRLAGCGPRDARVDNERGSGGNNSNCWEIRLSRSPFGLTIELRDGKEVKVRGDKAEIFSLSRRDSQALLALAGQRPELSDPAFYRDLAAEQATKLGDLQLTIVPVSHDEFPAGTHWMRFGNRRGPSMSANETAGLFIYLAEVNLSQGHGEQANVHWFTVPA